MHLPAGPGERSRAIAAALHASGVLQLRDAAAAEAGAEGEAEAEAEAGAGAGAGKGLRQAKG